MTLGRPRKHGLWGGKAKEPEVCSVGLCREEVSAKGRCRRHYKRYFKSEHFKNTYYQGAPCKHISLASKKRCETIAYSKGYCQYHYGKLARPPRKVGKCIKCKRKKPIVARSLCQSCYQKAVRLGTLPALTFLKETVPITVQQDILHLVDLCSVKGAISFKTWAATFDGISERHKNRKWTRLKGYIRNLGVPLVEGPKWHFLIPLSEREVKKQFFKRAVKKQS